MRLTCVLKHLVNHSHLFYFFCIEQEAEKTEDTSGGSGLSSLHRTYSQDCSFKNSMYHVGDYVYVEPAEANLLPHIVCIERLWEDSAGKEDQIVRGGNSFFNGLRGNVHSFRKA